MGCNGMNVTANANLQCGCGSTASASASAQITGTPDIPGLRSVTCYGADRTGAQASTQAFRDCIAALTTDGGGVCYIPAGVYVIGETILLPHNVSLKGTGGGATELRPEAGADYYDASGALGPNGFLFFWNIDPAAPDAWIQQYPNTLSGTVEDLSIIGNSAGSVGVKGFWFAGSMQFRNIYGRGISTLAAKPQGLYCDAVAAENVYCERVDGSSYLFDLPGLGDGWFFRHISANYDPTSGMDGAKGLRFAGCRGATVLGLINGDHTFLNCQALEIASAHLEIGHIELDSCEATVRDSLFCTEADPDLKGLTVRSSHAQQTGIVAIRDNVFMRMPNKRGGWPSTDYPDVEILDPQACVVLENNSRVLSLAGDTQVRQHMGILVGDGTGVYADWRDYSHMLSESARVSAHCVPVCGQVEDHLHAFGGFDSAGLTSGWAALGATWQDASGTYYYGVQLLTDPARMVGRTPSGTAVVSATPSNGGELVELIINHNAIRRRGGHILRVYRGSATGVYDRYVDIPCRHVTRLHDNGVALSGWPWQTRTPAGVDAMNANGFAGQAIYVDGLVQQYASADVPTAGTWKQGDEVLRKTGGVDAYGMLFHGVHRLTSGSAHALGTDWCVRYVSTMSPAT